MSEYARADVVVPQVDEIAVYYNPRADIVIRQTSATGDNDAVVVVPFEHLKALVKRLQTLAKARPEPEEG